MGYESEDVGGLVGMSRHPQMCGIPEGGWQAGLAGVEGAEPWGKAGDTPWSTPCAPTRFWEELYFSSQMVAESLQEAGPPPSQNL